MLAEHLTPDEQRVMDSFLAPAEWMQDGNLEPPRWIIEPFLALRTSTLLVADPKAGKTTFLLHMVKALLRGSSFLGQRYDRPLRVVYVTEETFTFRAAMMRAGLTASDGLFVVDNRQVASVTSWSSLLRILKSYVRAKRADVLIIDTYAHFAQFGEGQEQDAGVMVQRMAEVRRLVDSTGACVIVVHHSRKASGGGPGQRARGSNALAGAVDQLIGLSGSARSKVRTLEITGRLSDNLKMKVRLTTQGYEFADASNAEAEIGSRVAGQAPRRRLKLPDNEAEAINIEEVCKRNKLTESTARRHIAADPTIRRTGGGKKGMAYGYYRERVS